MKLQELKQKGIQVNIRHYRPLNGEKKLYRVSSIKELGLSKYLSTHGGETVVHVKVGDKWEKGVARCNPEDRFCYQTGVNLAIEKALGIVGFDETQHSMEC